MKILLFPILLISVSLSAQEKPKKQLIPKTDTILYPKLNPVKIQQPQQENQTKNLYKMPVAKPKEGTKYSGLNKKIEAKDYKMLKPASPEKPKDTVKAK
ncbi:hypothetical protein SAMN05443633_109150 [Chryseobacterium arachidis]|uniref:Uncharacterized protein n=1 Tax=Chryseobacterium arachidis TaxID=1416778 RepID=A0A1M5GJ53_9FLAO|nr:hypothetical protein [Chryseobacterium arachidis]SHG03706.1 hypothetical protein SAMN05443633_109150 [Chryseobacterium arachidis]